MHGLSAIEANTPVESRFATLHIKLNRSSQEPETDSERYYLSLPDQFVKAMLTPRRRQDFSGWVISEPSNWNIDTSASEITDFVLSPPSIGSMTSIYPGHIYEAAQNDLNTTTRRRVSLKEAALLARAIHNETIAREELSRELEASAWLYTDDL